MRLYGQLHHYQKLYEDHQNKFNRDIDEYRKVLKREIENRNKILRELGSSKLQIEEKEKEIVRLKK